MRSGSRKRIASNGLRRAGSSCVLVAAFLSACGGDSAEVRDPGAEEATLPGAVADTLEGLLRVGEDGLTFQPCGSGQESWVIESPGADLRVAADGLSVDAGAPMFARLVGGVVDPPNAGPGGARRAVSGGSSEPMPEVFEATLGGRSDMAVHRLFWTQPPRKNAISQPTE